MKKLTILLLATMAFAGCSKDQLPQPMSSPEFKILHEPCGDINTMDYPAEHKDDYRHPERFAGMDHVAVFGHIVTRKYANTLLPLLDNPADDLCGVNITLTNPTTGASHTWEDIFNWPSGLFNLNKEVSKLWHIHSGVIDFPCIIIHVSNGADYNFGHDTVRLDFAGL